MEYATGFIHPVPPPLGPAPKHHFFKLSVQSTQRFKLNNPEQ